MFANWLRLGLTSGRITTSYPHRRPEVLRDHRLWKVLPQVSTVSSFQEAQIRVNKCPTQALTLTVNTDDFQLSLDRGACIACGRCIEAQSQEVLWGEEGLDLAVLERQGLMTHQPIVGGVIDGERG